MISFLPYSFLIPILPNKLFFLMCLINILLFVYIPNFTLCTRFLKSVHVAVGHLVPCDAKYSTCCLLTLPAIQTQSIFNIQPPKQCYNAISPCMSPYELVWELISGYIYPGTELLGPSEFYQLNDEELPNCSAEWLHWTILLEVPISLHPRQDLALSSFAF